MKKNGLRYLVAVFMLILSAQVWGQNSAITVSGKVSDSKGEPLSGITVIVEGTRKGTSTNSKGDYTITVPSKESVLVFSMLSMKTVSHRVGNRTTINVTMQEDAVGMDEVEVVAIGYGSTRRSDLTGSISSIDKDALSDRAIVSLEDAMRGKAAGLQIIQNDGSPGSDYTIRIRGASSVNASSAPIFVIDGVICDDASFLNPGDVESIEILKDASSTAIYGSRGANGVILVTTRQGSSDNKTRVELYANFGFQEAVREYDMLNSADYTYLRYKAGWKYYPYGTSPSSFEEGTVYRDNPNGDGNYWVLPVGSPYENWQAYNHPDSVNTRWQDLMFRKAIYQEYRINVSGGNKNTRYSVSGGYLNQDGIVINSGYERYTGRVNLTQNLAKTVTMTANLSASRTKNSGLATGSSDGLIMKLLRQPPTYSADSDNIMEGEGDEQGNVISNPYAQVRDITNDRYRDELTARLQVEWKILPQLSLRGAGTYQDNHQKAEVFYPADTEQGFKMHGRGIVSSTEVKKLSGEAFLTYSNTWKGNHKLRLLGGSTIETYRSNVLRVENQDFPELNLGVDGMGMGIAPQIPTTSIVDWNMVSFIARAEYNYKERYLLTASYRADGSSRFGAGNKWAGFPSVGLAWRINEEPFIKDLNVFYNLKLRFGYGRSGNTAIPAYRSLSTIATSFYPMNGSDLTYGAIIDRPANTDLRWETTDMINLGLDMAFFDNRLALTLDLYNKETKDLLLEKNAALATGYKTGWANIGSVRNQGVEVTVDAVPVSNRRWNWSMNFNIGFNRSKVLDIGPGGEMGFDPGIIPGSGNFVMIRKGKSLGQWYGYKIEGIYGSQYEIDEHGLTEVLGQKIANIYPGTYRFHDENNDGKITSADQVLLGSGEPLFTGGFTNTVSYKSLTLSVAMQFSYGATVFNANLHSLTSGRDGHNQITAMRDSWSPTLYDESGNLVLAGNPNAKYRMPGGVALNYCTSKMLEDGSFLRIGDVTLSYAFPQKLARKIGMSGLKFFASVKNLWIFTDYSGYDPEVNTRQGQTGDLMPSLDYSAYPRNRSYSVGFNFIF
ncbi:MAG TPA: TonB-dependent receptor [Candidatus Alistipes intestinigallinarum]|uniref:TonB-dependent receptor n=1 Tax=Candidatus Alistipes intestinigallinarum TaxID=2838440 RepID=A0A9D1Z1T2_9BACT|nr:TonB-dependent receptor [Candidatus Alistipes intestinigallinarum]